MATDPDATLEWSGQFVQGVEVGQMLFYNDAGDLEVAYVTKGPAREVEVDGTVSQLHEVEEMADGSIKLKDKKFKKAKKLDDKPK